MVIYVEGILNSLVLCLIGVVELEEVLKVLEIIKDAIVSQEVHGILVCHTKVLFFVFLLVLEDKVVEENFI